MSVSLGASAPFIIGVILGALIIYYTKVRA